VIGVALDQVAVCVGLGGEDVAQPLHRRKEVAVQLLDHRHVHGGGEGVV